MGESEGQEDGIGYSSSIPHDRRGGQSVSVMQDIRLWLEHQIKRQYSAASSR